MASQSLVPVNFWELLPGNTERPVAHQVLYDNVFVAHQVGNQSLLQRALRATDAAPVSVELSTEPDFWTRVSADQGTYDRHFWLRERQSLCMREMDIEEGGLGHCVWNAGETSGIQTHAPETT